LDRLGGSNQRWFAISPQVKASGLPLQ